MGKQFPTAAGSANSRRRFVLQALATAVGAPFVFSSRADAAARVAGEITLDALLVTYFSAPFGAGATATYELTTRYESTLALSGLEGVELRARVPSSAERVMLGAAFLQRRTNDNALLLRRRDRRTEIEVSTTTPAPGGTVFYGFTRPRLQLKEFPSHGGDLRIGYRLLGAESVFTFTRDSLLHDPLVSALLAPSTIQSFLATYRFEGLDEVRYATRGTFGGGQTVTLFERGSSSQSNLAVSTSVTIVAQEGFTDADLAAIFAEGREIEVAHVGRQTPTSQPIVEAHATLGPEGASVFWDRAMKAFVFVEPVV